MNAIQQKLPSSIDILNGLGEIAHQLQLERGRTALFIDSESPLFDDKLTAQYAATDGAMLAMQEVIARFNQTDKEKWTKRLARITQNDTHLAEHRTKVRSLSLSFSRALNAYTYSLLCPILDLSVELALEIENVSPVEVSAYSNFMLWKERVGRERAWGVHGFHSENFDNLAFIEQMTTLIQEQDAYKRAFVSLAAPEQAERVERIQSTYAMETLETIHLQLTQSDASEDFETLSPITWFDLLSGKVDRMRIAEQSLVEDLDPKKPQKTQAPAKFGQHDRLERHMPLIRSLAAFSKLSDDELSDLLAHGDIRTCNKGKLLFTQGETLSRLYLILEGWVKSYRGTAGGDETVLQMLSAGDTLMEAAVFLDVPSQVSVQVVQEATLLSIPAPIVRQSLLSNKNFALNMIGSLSMRSQGLIHQIEQSRLKTPTERVGWFLLKLGLEQNGGKLTEISLPYDKSTIASYLDMRPETFSRTLKTFRDKGFNIKNDQISNPDPKSLCNFCDDLLAGACIYKDEKSCPRKYGL